MSAWIAVVLLATGMGSARDADAGAVPPVPQKAAAPIEERADLRSIIDSTGFTGTVLVYDVRRDRWIGVNAQGADRRHIPASTFKIPNSLIALETGILKDEHTVIPWDSVPRPRTELNRDLELIDAFRLSAVPHFQEIARRIGPERMQRYIDRVGYGNRALSGGIDRFWLDGGLRISPREEALFVARLYRGDLPFSKHAMDVVRRIMVVEETPDYTLRAKTGWGILPDGHVGWWVGWVERGDDAYVFATVLLGRPDTKSFGQARQRVTRSVLRALGVLRGTAP
jgi:beta-lactamase class D